MYKTQHRISIDSYTNNRHHQYAQYNAPTTTETSEQQKNWESFRNQIVENLRPSIPLKTTEGIEQAITPEDKPQAKYPE
jgi:hypothetical protein